MGIDRVYRGSLTIMYSDTQPTNLEVLWADTSSEPHILKYYDKIDEKWVVTGTPLNDVIIPAEQIITDSNNRFVTDAQIANFSDHYTKEEIDSRLQQDADTSPWKPTVAIFSDIASEYPNPEDGWTVNSQDTGWTYRYVASSNSWVPISANSIPLASDSVNGLMSSEDKSKLDLIPASVATNLDSKADKVSGATEGNWAALDSTGNLVDSGWNSSMFVPISEFALKADKVLNGTNGNFVTLDGGGNIQDSGKSPSSFLLSPSTYTSGNVVQYDSSGQVVSTVFPAALATERSNGFMSNSDKVKLDQIQAGAQVNQNAWSIIRVNNSSINSTTSNDTFTIQSSGVVTLTTNGKTLTIGVDGTMFAPMSHVGSGGNAHALVTESIAGFMSPEDKVKLDSITISGDGSIAENTFFSFSFNDNNGDNLASISSTSPTDVFTFSEAMGIVFVPDTENKAVSIGIDQTFVATDSSNGLMSSSDKQKLDSIVMPNGGGNVTFATNAFSYFSFEDVYGNSLTGYPIQSSNASDTIHFREGNGIAFTVNNASKFIEISINTNGIPAATESSNGLMSFSDKTKLDGIGDATTDKTGLIQIAGVLSGTATNPSLASTGVESGTYTYPQITVGADGRITSISNMSPGDMYKSTYDTNDDGIVDHAELSDNASNLGGNPPSYYQKAITISPTAPDNPVVNDIWLNTSQTTFIWQEYDGTQWNAIGGSGGSSIDDAVTSTSSTWSSTKISELTSDCMPKSTYDTNGDGIVDHAALADVATTANNATNFGGNPVSYYDKFITRSSKAPSSPLVDDLWIDTSNNPNTMKRYDGTTWVVVGYEQQIINDSITSSTTTWSSSQISNTFSSFTIPWNKITSAPNSSPSAIDMAVSEAHTHSNKAVLDLFTSGSGGTLLYNGSQLGDMLKSIYDTNNDGIIDVAATLNGLVSTIAELNYVHGVTSNIQDQLDSVSLSVQWKGYLQTYADISTQFPNPLNGWLVVVYTDENYSNHRTAYIYNDNSSSWQFIGYLDTPPNATMTSMGLIQISGDLTGTASNPQLIATGVTAGSYINPNITVDAKGRVTSISNGESPSSIIDDSRIGQGITWSSYYINELIGVNNSTGEANAANIGTMSNLITPQTDNLVDAINSVQKEIGSSLQYLTTPYKTTLIDAINSLQSQIPQSGFGDMMKSTYDTNGNGVVDNSEKLGGQLPSYYALSSDITSINSKIGDLTQLTVANDGNIVSAINGISSRVALSGTQFISNASDSQQFYRTDLDQWYFYSSAAGAWIQL
ncbi:hypothetical protein QB910_000047 [Dabrowskivirus KKP3916]|uniref:Tail fiber protein n=1 Tax=Alicyclobacillus phage KKP_3916 TaxID=3040651 RepID=A0AAT9V884_9CAUD|nr:hypothetical protein QB910_000047 [Alicyclobacillus phage KKP 3916]